MNMATLNESLKSFSKRKKPELQSQFPFLKEYQIMEKIKKQWNNKHGSSGSLHKGTIHKGMYVCMCIYIYILHNIYIHNYYNCTCRVR